MIKNISRFKLMSWVLLSLTFTLFAVVMYQAFQLQILNYDQYKALASKQHHSQYTFQGQRGNIYIQDYTNDQDFLVATNRQTYDVIIDPLVLSQSSSDRQEEVFQILHKTLGIDRTRFDKILGKTNRRWERIATDVAYERGEELNQRIDGDEVYFESQYERYYPEQTFASSVLGYTQRDNISQGKYGIEQYYNSKLQGTQGFETRERAATGSLWLPFGERVREEAQDGKDLVLHIDHTIQYRLEETLEKLMETYSAKEAFGVIMDPETGNVLAMGNRPSFNPNQYYEVESIAQLRNPIVSNLYEPGSIFKPFTVGVGLSKGVITPGSSYEDTGTREINNFTVRNVESKAHGVQNISYALANSLNLGMVHIQEQIGRQQFVQGLTQDLALEKPTEIDLPNEAQPNFRNIQLSERDARAINYATASFGQGISIPPLQVLATFNGIVNDGVMMRPQVVKELQGESAIEEISPERQQRILSKENARKLQDMLVYAVNEGHGKPAQVAGYRIGGKTGTAQIAVEGGYGEETLQSFVQFVQGQEQTYTVLLSVNSPDDARFSNETVVPASRELNRFLIQYLGMEARQMQDKQES